MLNMLNKLTIPLPPSVGRKTPSHKTPVPITCNVDPFDSTCKGAWEHPEPRCWLRHADTLKIAPKPGGLDPKKEPWLLVMEGLLPSGPKPNGPLVLYGAQLVLCIPRRGWGAPTMLWIQSWTRSTFKLNACNFEVERVQLLVLTSWTQGSYF